MVTVTLLSRLEWLEKVGAMAGCAIDATVIAGKETEG